jgi:cob(I)alamin adenosyltransferase
MVKLNRIYTRTGDDGTTGLADGSRRPKHDVRMIAIGSVDESNAAIGLARLHADGAVDDLLAQVQNDLFDLGADLATPSDDVKWPPLRIKAAQVTALEAALDAYNEALESLTSFILPAGTPLSAHLHMARTIARRAERDTAALADMESINPEIMKYMNRLSDLLFVLARHANDGGRADVLWVPSKA